MKAIIAVDLDGFLTTYGPTGRLRLPDFLYFLALMVYRPKPNRENIIRVNSFKDAGYEVVILSARPEITRSITKRWLRKYDIKVDDVVLVGPGNVREKKLTALKEREINYYFGDSGRTVNYLSKKGVIAYKI